MRKPAECGTTSGYSGHKRRGEDACAPCLAAIRDYQRTYRRGKGQAATRRVKEREAARDRALRRLAALYPAQLEALLAEEMER